MEVEDTFYNDQFQDNVEGKKIVRPPTSEDWDKSDNLVKFMVIFYDSILVDLTMQVLINVIMKWLLSKGILIIYFLLQ